MNGDLESSTGEEHASDGRAGPGIIHYTEECKINR